LQPIQFRSVSLQVLELTILFANGHKAENINKLIAKIMMLYKNCLEIIEKLLNLFQIINYKKQIKWNISTMEYQDIFKKCMSH